MKSLSSNTIIKAILFIFVIGLTASSCKKEHKKGPKSIYGTIANDPNYSFLTAAVNKAGLMSALNDDSKPALTLFAPTNDAFIAAGFNTAADLTSVPDSTLTAILLY